MSDSDIKLEMIRLIDSQRGASLIRLYELIREEISPDKIEAEEELTPLEQGYKEMSEDEERESEAFEWIEGTVNAENMLNCVCVLVALKNQDPSNPCHFCHISCYNTVDVLLT